MVEILSGGLSTSTAPKSIIDRMFTETFVCWCSFSGITGKDNRPKVKLGDTRVWSLMLDIYNKLFDYPASDISVSIFGF
jgi:hypothetical protein